MSPLKSYLLILIATLAPPAAHALGGLYSGVEGEQQPASPEPQEPICGVPLPRPPRDDKIGTARWIVRSLDWGVLSTISTRLVGEYTEDGEEEGGIRGYIPPKPVPFGNVYSYADGTCANSTGIPYLYATSLDQSMIDAQSNPRVSLTLSEASLAGRGVEGAGSSCRATEKGWGDPEMPPCVRLTITGELKRLSLEDEDGGGRGGFCGRGLDGEAPVRQILASKSQAVRRQDHYRGYLAAGLVRGSVSFGSGRVPILRWRDRGGGGGGGDLREELFARLREGWGGARDAFAVDLTEFALPSEGGQKVRGGKMWWL